MFPKILVGTPSTWTGKTVRESDFDLKTLTSCYSCLDMAGTARTLKLQGVKSSLNSRKSYEQQHEASKQNCQNSFMKKLEEESQKKNRHIIGCQQDSYSDCTEKRNFQSEPEVRKRCTIISNSLSFYTNYGLEFKVAFHCMFKMVTRNNCSKFFMNSEIARKKTDTLSSI